MPFSSMILLILFILSSAGVGSRTLRSYGIRRKNAVFFLLCLYALKQFGIRIGDDAVLSASSFLISVWLFGNSFNSEKITGSVLIVPFCIIISLILITISCFDFRLSLIIAVLIPGFLSVINGIIPAMCAGGLLPPVFLIARCFYDVFKLGFVSFEIGETCLIMQLSGMFVSAAAGLFKEIVLNKRSNFSIRSY